MTKVHRDYNVKDLGESQKTASDKTEQLKCIRNRHKNTLALQK